MIPFEFLRLVPRNGTVGVDVIAHRLDRLAYVGRVGDGLRWAVAPSRRHLEGRLERPGRNPPSLFVSGGDIVLEGAWDTLDLGRIRQFVEWLASRDDWRVSKIASLDWPEPERDLGWLSQPGMLDDLFGPLLAEDPYPLQWPIETGQLLEWSLATTEWNRSLVLHTGGRFEYDADDRELEGRLADEHLSPWRATLERFDEDDPAFPDEWDFSPIAFVAVHTPEREGFNCAYDPDAPPPTVADLHALALRLDAQCRGWRDGDPLPVGIAELRVRAR